MSDISIWRRFCRWLRTWRRCEHCGKRSNDSTRGSAFCGNCDGGYSDPKGWRIMCPKCKLDQACDESNEPVTCKNCKYTWNG